MTWTTPTKNLDQRVEAGATWLDTYGPADWAQRVEPARLHMASAYRCVLGQVFADRAIADRGEEEDGYSYACDLAVENGSAGNDPGFLWGQTHGFAGNEGDLNALEGRWLRLIADRAATLAPA